MKPGDLVTFNRVFPGGGPLGYNADISPGDVGIYVEIVGCSWAKVLIQDKIWQFRESDIEPVRQGEVVVQ
jgi:hypothetical protein